MTRTPNDKAVEAAAKKMQAMLEEKSPDVQRQVFYRAFVWILLKAVAPHIERAFVDRLTDDDWHRLRHLLTASAKNQLGTDNIKNTGRRQLKGLISK